MEAIAVAEFDASCAAAKLKVDSPDNFLVRELRQTFINFMIEVIQMEDLVQRLDREARWQFNSLAKVSDSAFYMTATGVSFAKAVSSRLGITGTCKSTRAGQPLGTHGSRPTTIVLPQPPRACAINSRK